MSKPLPLLFAITILALSHAACDGAAPADEAGADDAIAQVYSGQLTVAQAQTACRCRLEVVPVGGTVFHFGLDLAQAPPAPYPFQSTVAGARVWIGELPITRALNIRSDADGRWSFKAVKLRGTPLRHVVRLRARRLSDHEVAGVRNRRRRRHRRGSPASHRGVLPRGQGADRTADRRAHRRALQPAQRAGHHGRQVLGVDVFDRAAARRSRRPGRHHARRSSSRRHSAPCTSTKRWRPIRR